MILGDKMKRLLMILMAALFIVMPFQKVEALPDDEIVVHYFFSAT
jgi:hypothetical protein